MARFALARRAGLGGIDKPPSSAVDRFDGRRTPRETTCAEVLSQGQVVPTLLPASLTQRAARS